MGQGTNEQIPSLDEIIRRKNVFAVGNIIVPKPEQAFCFTPGWCAVVLSRKQVLLVSMPSEGPRKSVTEVDHMEPLSNMLMVIATIEDCE